MVLLLVDLNSKIDHVIVKINFHSSCSLHDLLIFGDYHVLCEVVLSAELSEIVTTDLVRVKVRPCNRNHIVVLTFICVLIRTVNIDCASQLLVLIVLVHLLVVIDGSRLRVEVESDDP